METEVPTGVSGLVPPSPALHSLPTGVLGVEGWACSYSGAPASGLSGREPSSDPSQALQGSKRPHQKSRGCQQASGRCACLQGQMR